MKIVVGVDDSDISEHALERALLLAERLGAEVDVVFVSHIPATVLAAMTGVPMATEDFSTAQRNAVWNRIDPVISGAAVPVEKVEMEGYPPDCLVDHATAVGADMIVVGSRGRGPLASLLLGTTSHRVVNHSPCDVLVVRRSEEESG